MSDSRSFSLDDQQGFAALTGDHNPIHMDPVAARRTQAGAPVVHGIHSMLWLLEVIARDQPELPPLSALRVRFSRMVYIGETVEAALTRRSPGEWRATLSVGGAVAVQLTATLGALKPAADMEPPAGAPGPWPRAPLDPPMAAMATAAGWLSLDGMAAGMARLFPCAARLLGAHRLAALGGSTLMVGMVLPGLHSLYRGLTLDLTPDTSDRLAYRAEVLDPRFRLLRIQVQGGGLAGTVEAIVRQPPAAQADMAAVAARVAPGAFAGATALVVGGSRGLGELTAKAIAAGGGQVILTYAVGKADAERVAAAIAAWGGRCRAVPLDVLESGDPFAAFPDRPTHVYYFATPPILGLKAAGFSESRFSRFTAFYVSGLARVVEAARRRRPEGVRVFYPSSVFVAKRPEHMTEYAMAKAAGEILCADLNAAEKNPFIVCHRLPRLLTDQTAMDADDEMPDALEILLPIIRETQG